MLAESLPGEQTPVTNRGVTVTWMGVHWLSGVSRLSPELVREIVSRHMLGLVLEPSERGIWTYKHKALERSTGAFVAWTVDRLDVAINLPGTACELLGTVGIQELARELELTVTRLDLAWDTENLMTPELVRNAHESGAAVTHCKVTDWRESKGGKKAGSTFYVGNRSASAARLVRFYDMRGPTRVELEVHKERASMLWQVLDDINQEDWSAAGLAYLVDFVDFRERSADPNVGRCPRLDWWDSFTEGAGRLALPLPRKAPNLESQKEWLENQVCSTFAIVVDSVTDSTKWVEQMLRKGRARRTPRQAALLNASQIDITGVILRV